VQTSKGWLSTTAENKKSRMLLVDDEPDIVYLVTIGLERKGLAVDCYSDPVLALQNFKTGLYQLLVLDIKMPQMDGIELFNRMKKKTIKLKYASFQRRTNFHF
jgi:DNA-binding response OmpR family regulator